jgi:hypothetical protein
MQRQHRPLKFSEKLQTRCGPNAKQARDVRSEEAVGPVTG